jgi:hypothetical protein
MCKAGGHSPTDPGCYTRAEHYYAGGIASSLAAIGRGGDEGHQHYGNKSSAGDTDAPQPRLGGKLPVPTPLSPKY